MDNNYVAGVQMTVLNFANGGGGTGSRPTTRSATPCSCGRPRNALLRRRRDGDNTDNTANLTAVDPKIKTSYDGFISPATKSYRPVKATDFNRFYRDSVSRGGPRR